MYSWKLTHKPIIAKYYRNNILLFTKSYNKSPSIVIHGDGITEAGTFFTINEKVLNIYNMSNTFIKSVLLGPDMFVGLVNLVCWFSEFSLLV